MNENEVVAPSAPKLFPNLKPIIKEMMDVCRKKELTKDQSRQCAAQFLAFVIFSTCDSLCEAEMHFFGGWGQWAWDSVRDLFRGFEEPGEDDTKPEER
jgi:hypothetical protein